MGRVIQQLRSFGELHANELEQMAVELDAANASDVARQLRAYRDVQRDEAQMVIDELVDIQTDLAATAQSADPPGVSATADVASADPAVNSPRRARWLAEQAAEAQRLRQPQSRRDLFGRALSKPEDET